MAGAVEAGAVSPAGSSPYISLQLREGYAILSMHKEPVNSMDLGMWRALAGALTALEADTRVHGLIITSGLKRDVFTAGNDLNELYPPRTSKSRYRTFWEESNAFLCALARTRLATIAAIRGACPAGGCMMSMCCDHRVMTANGTIGLNEVQLGIPVPKYWGLLMSRLVGPKAADKLLLTGKLITPVEAKALGLVDQVVDRSEQLLPAAEKVMAGLVKLPGGAVAASKRSLREDFCAAWEAYYVQEPEGAWEFLNQPATLQKMEGVLARLSSGAGSGKSGSSQPTNPPAKL